MLTENRIKYVILSIFIAITLVIFGNTLAGDFVFDDLVIVRDRPELKDIKYLPYLLIDPYHQLGYNSDIYRPITMASFSLNFAILGNKPWGFHLVNILLHALASWLVFLLLWRLLKKLDLAFLVALIFLILPIHTEPVNAIVGRAEILSLLFTTASLLVLLNPKKSKAKKITPLFYAALLFLFGLMSKESALGMFPLYITAVWLLENKSGILTRLKSIFRKYWQSFIYLGGAMAIYFTMRGLVLDKMINTNATIVENPLKFLPAWERIIVAIKITGIYIVKIIWPYNNLSSDHSYNQIPVNIDWINPLLWLGVFTLLGMTILLFMAIAKPPRKNNNYFILILASGYFLFFFLPVSNLLFPIGTILAERLMYIPSLGVCLLLGLALILLRNMLRNKKFSQYFYVTTALLIIIFYSYVSFDHNFDWQSEAKLFASAAQRSPNSVLARSNLGAIYLLDNKLDLAQREILAAQEIYDNYNHNLNNLGLLYLRQGRLEEARDQFILTLKKHPSYGRAIDNLALTYFRLSEYDKAKKFWTIIHGADTAQIYLITYFNNEFTEFLKENKKTQARELLEQVKTVVNDRQWLKSVEAVIEDMSAVN